MESSAIVFAGPALILVPGRFRETPIVLVELT